MRAAIDCGTNSFRLLITDDDRQPLVQELRITRLGEGVHEHRIIQSRAMERAIGALSEFAELLRVHEVQHVRAVATSAARDAGNGAEFLARAQRALGGVELEVLSGTTEGELTFRGVTTGLDVGGPVLVVDIGGGSTEFAFGVDGELRWAQSLDIGSVRLTELAFHADPYGAQEIRQATDRVVEELGRIDLSAVPETTRFVGVAGTITTLAMISRQMPQYEPDIVHGLEMTAAEADAISDSLLRMTDTQRLSIPGLPAGRADVIAAGSIIYRHCFALGHFPICTVSERDLLFGLLE